MGQSSSTPSTTRSSTQHILSTTSVRRRSTKSTAPPILLNDAVFTLGGSLSDMIPDFTSELPDECLALIFQSLGPADRNSCSLVCRRWLRVEGQSRNRISLNARAALLEVVPDLFSRFDSVTKLALKCDRRNAESIGDEAIVLISVSCRFLTRLKLRSCSEVTDEGMAVLARNCKHLKKLSCGSCGFGAKGISAVVSSCSLLEDLSIKRLRGLTDGAEMIVAPKSSGLRSICLKGICNGHYFAPLIAESPKLKTLKLYRCSGDWDSLFEEITRKVTGLVEVHLERLQIGDRGISTFTSCLNLEVFHAVKNPECTDAGISAIAGGCRLLRKIHIDGWKSKRIGDEGLSSIARSCLNLQELVLIGVNSTLVSIELIAENCRNLERLALCSTETIGDAEISCIASRCFSLKKLCIKGCAISNQGMEALATGCPSLLKVKVKKCHLVTTAAANLLRATREALTVNLDIGSQAVVDQADASASESGVQENGDEQFPAMADGNLASDVPSSSNSRSVLSKAKLRLLLGRNLLASTIRKLSHSSSKEHHSQCA